MKNLIIVLTFMIYSSVSIAGNNMSEHRYNEIQNFLNRSSEFKSFIYRYGMDDVINAYEDSNIEYCNQYKRKRIAISCVKDQMYNFLELNVIQPEPIDVDSKEFENIMVKVRNAWEDIIEREGKIEFDSMIKTHVLLRCDTNAMKTTYKNRDLTYCLIGETFSYYKHDR